MQLEDDFYNEDGTIKGLIGAISFFTKSKLKQRFVVFDYSIRHENTDPNKGAKTLIDQLKKDIALLEKWSLSEFNDDELEDQ